jgi:hypothetical protein
VCRSIERRNPGKSPSASFRRDLDPDKATLHAVSSRSRPRQCHFACRFVGDKACSCIEIRTSAKRQGQSLHWDLDLAKATLRAVVSRSRSRRADKARHTAMQDDHITCRRRTNRRFRYQWPALLGDNCRYWPVQFIANPAHRDTRPTNFPRN